MPVHLSTDKGRRGLRADTRPVCSREGPFQNATNMPGEQSRVSTRSTIARHAYNSVSLLRCICCAAHRAVLWRGTAKVCILVDCSAAKVTISLRQDVSGNGYQRLEYCRLNIGLPGRHVPAAHPEMGNTNGSFPVAPRVLTCRRNLPFGREALRFFRDHPRTAAPRAVRSAVSPAVLTTDSSKPGCLFHTSRLTIGLVLSASGNGTLAMHAGKCKSQKLTQCTLGVMGMYA
jgi:hypothetical protein